MESTGEALKIQISESTHQLLSKDKSFCIEHRGSLDFKVAHQLI
jgi:hypothetical protein